MKRYGQHKSQRDDNFILELSVFAFVVRAVACAEKRRSKPLPVASSHKIDK